MPAAYLVAGAITRLAPLNWIGPAISLVVLRLLASLALLRALHVILCWRPRSASPNAIESGRSATESAAEYAVPQYDSCGADCPAVAGGTTESSS